MRTSATAHYRFIEVALATQRKEFLCLLEEMEQFIPRQESAFRPDRAKLLKELRTLNPDAAARDLRKMVKGQYALAARPDVQFKLKFTNSFVALSLTSALLAHALCEATINAVLAHSLASENNAELFAVAERASVLEKWVIVPKLLDTKYVLPKGEQLYLALNELTKRRNGLVHHKISLEVDGRQVLEGSYTGTGSFLEETRWLEKFFNLPYELFQHLSSTIRKRFLLPVLTAHRPVVFVDRAARIFRRFENSRASS